MLESTLNNTPYYTRSMVSPESLVNPRTIVKYLSVPKKSLMNESKIGEVSRILHDIRSSQLYEHHKHQQKVQNCNEPVIGQLVWFFKNKDNPKLGILFGTVLKKIGSDFKIQISNGGKAKISNQRLFLIFGKSEKV